MTIFEKQIARMLVEHCRNATAETVVRKLFEMGVTDAKRCRAVVVRDHVRTLTANGNGKVQAMYMAAEQYGLSYECVRDYVYSNQYSDTNSIQSNFSHK